jgi:transglutaminase-like putative cysteine protease
VKSAGRVVVDFIDYDYELVENNDYWYGLESVIQSRKGICLAYAMLTERILREIGIEAEISSGTMVMRGSDDDGTYAKTGRHAWVRVNVNQGTTDSEKWMFCDPTFSDSCKYSDTCKEAHLDCSYDSIIYYRRMEGVLPEATEKGQYYTKVY